MFRHAVRPGRGGGWHGEVQVHGRYRKKRRKEEGSRVAWEGRVRRV